MNFDIVKRLLRKARLFIQYKIRMSTAQIIAGGFLMIILAGTILLMLPAATRTGVSTGFIDALFTATSATCVTGLVVF